MDGAAYVLSDARSTPSSAMSFDLLRSVSVYLGRRQPAAPTAAGGGIPTGDDEDEQQDFRLTVRSAPRPAPLSYRRELTSDYELSCVAELVERTPGRIIMFCEGIAPLPVQGAATL